MGTKIEIKLEKAENIQWTGLDYSARKLDQPINVSNGKPSEFRFSTIVTLYISLGLQYLPYSPMFSLDPLESCYFQAI
jgi:hypothetical protein